MATFGKGGSSGHICTNFIRYSKYSFSFTNVVPCILDTVRGSLMPAWLFEFYFFIEQILLTIAIKWNIDLLSGLFI